MDDSIEYLSDEMLDLCSSFDTTITSACESPSIQQASQVSFENSNNGIVFYSKSPNSHSEFQGNKFLNNSVDFLNSSPNSSNLTTRTFESLLHSRGRLPSTDKLQEYKKVLSEVNDACTLWMMTEFVLDCCKASKHVPPQIAAKAKEIMTVSRIHESAVIRSRNGKTFNVLGLNNDDIKRVADKTMSTLERMELSKHTIPTLKTNIEQLKGQRSVLTGQFGSHCQKVVHTDTLLCEEQEQLATLHQDVGARIGQASQLVMSSSQVMQALALLVNKSAHELETNSFISLRDKAKHLHCTASVLKLSVENSEYKDESRTAAINALGYKLKTTVDELGEQLKGLQKALSEYERQEQSSERFKAIVADYAKVKRQLQHKYQTLDVLNEPDVSFS